MILWLEDSPSLPSQGQDLLDAAVISLTDITVVVDSAPLAATQTTTATSEDGKKKLKKIRLRRDQTGGSPYLDRWSGVFTLAHELYHALNPNDTGEEKAVATEDEVRRELGYKDGSLRKDYDTTGRPGRDKSGPGY
jgi:hypothetical protein